MKVLHVMLLSNNVLYKVWNLEEVKAVVQQVREGTDNGPVTGCSQGC